MHVVYARLNRLCKYYMYNFHCYARLGNIFPNYVSLKNTFGYCANLIKRNPIVVANFLSTDFLFHFLPRYALIVPPNNNVEFLSIYLL